MGGGNLELNSHYFPYNFPWCFPVSLFVGQKVTTGAFKTFQSHLYRNLHKDQGRERDEERKGAFFLWDHWNLALAILLLKKPLSS